MNQRCQLDFTNTLNLMIVTNSSTNTQYSFSHRIALPIIDSRPDKH